MSVEKGTEKRKFHIDRIGIWLLYLSVTLEIILVIVDKSNYINPIEASYSVLRFFWRPGRYCVPNIP